jgi:hypothetical protein
MSTPPSAPAPILDSTPQSKGSGSHHNHASEHTQKDYAPYLQEDLTHEKTITVAEYFEWILRINNAEDTSRMENDPNFQKYMANYNRWDAYKHETELYKPFVELANYCLGRKSKIQFCRDDPTIVLGSDAERKPDTVNIWWAALALGSRTSVDNLSGGGPGKLDAFHWMEILAFWEFKFVLGGVSPGTRRHLYDPSCSDAVMNSQSGQLNSGAAATEEGGEEGSPSPQQSGTKTKNRSTRWPADDDEV